jgi:hypothetical protein
MKLDTNRFFRELVNQVVHAETRNGALVGSRQWTFHLAKLSRCLSLFIFEFVVSQSGFNWLDLERVSNPM